MDTETLVSTIFQLYRCFQFHQCDGPSNVTDKLLSQMGINQRTNTNTRYTSS